MSSRELGLLLAQQLLGVQDLHYGLWEPDLELSLANLAEAQRRYSERLFSHLPPARSSEGGTRLLDVGCGTGHMLVRLLDLGYRVDVVNPSAGLNRLVRERLVQRPDHGVQLMECRFQDLPSHWGEGAYDGVLFSESFQYIPLRDSLAGLCRLLRPGGRAVIGDFFRTEAHRRGEEGDRSFGGGQPLQEFYSRVQASPLRLDFDEDITSLTSPNVQLLDEWLRRRLAPAVSTLDAYLAGRRPWLYRLVKAVFRRRLQRLQYKYLAGHRSREVFERYKSYRLLVLRKGG
jgi:SAM-dependent methyltransferase